MLLSTPFVPFTFALGLLFGLLLLEVVGLLLGLSIFGHTGDVDIPADHGLDLEAQPNVEALLSHQASPLPETETRGAPLMVTCAAALLGFGVTGILVQSLASAVAGPMPLWAAVILASVLGLGFARAFGGVFARLIPSIQTTATSAQFLGGIQGVVTQGTARRGAAAEVRLRDRHGNLHHFRCEPLNDADVIPQGTPVITIRRRNGDGFILRILPLT